MPASAAARTGIDGEGTKPADPSLAVVVPMFNEEAQAERCVRLVCAALDALPGRAAMIAVDDGSRDATLTVLRRLAQELPRLTVAAHGANYGYGAALQTGSARAAESGFDYVLFMDSDLTNDPAVIPAFLDRMRQGYDLIKASRYVAGGRVEGVPAWRWLVSVVGNAVARRLLRLPIRDCTNGFRALRVSLLSEMRLQERGFPIIMEELYQARFLAPRFCEVPHTLTARGPGQRASSFSYTPRVLLGYLKYPLRAFLGRPPGHLRHRVAQTGGGT